MYGAFYGCNALPAASKHGNVMSLVPDLLQILSFQVHETLEPTLFQYFRPWIILENV